MRPRTALGLAVLLACVSCRDLSSFTTGGDSYDGLVVAGDFVRVGVDAGTSMCITLDTNHLQDAPGNLSTSDGRFHAVPMRPIPQIWHDPLSTLSFGQGRVKNLVYMVAASTPFDDTGGSDEVAVVSLLESGGVEVRLIRSAPSFPDDGGPAASSAPANVFAVFSLSRQKGPCSY